MGRRSTKENKNIFQISRENLGLTREEAAELLTYISDDRIEKIESEKVVPHPDEVLTMSECYKNALIPNRYCSTECPIGKLYVPKAEPERLQNITLEILNSLNALHSWRDRLIEIAVDGKVSESELRDFEAIERELDEISMAVHTLKIWINQKKYDDEYGVEES